MSERYTVARISRDGEQFEILVKPQPALNYRMGKTTSISEALAAETIFSDANKGTRASEDKLKAAFKTIDTKEIATTILRKGTLQLTTDQRKQLTSEKRKQIIAFIARQAVDPRSNLPHPPIRVEQAMDQIRYSIDPFKETEEQAKEVMKLLRPILPLKVENIRVKVSIPTEFAARAYGTVKGYGEMKSDEWRADGSWISVIEMPAGLFGPFLDKLGDLTKGTAEAKRV